MSETIAHIESISQNSRGWYELLDEFGTKYSTKKNAIAERAKDYVGKPATIHYTVRENGEYRDNLLDKVTDPPSSNGDGPSEPKRAESSVAYLAETAWQCAARMANSELGYDAAKHLADRIFADLKLKAGVAEDDYPF